MEVGKTLIIGRFTLDGIEAQAILDTGATASFIAQLGCITRALGPTTHSERIQIQTADAHCLTSCQQIETIICPINLPQYSKQIKLIVIPDKKDLMGYEVILGLDALKSFNIKLETHEETMVATIDNHKIGCDIKISGSSLLAMRDSRIDPFDSLTKQFACIFAESAKTFIDTSPMTIPLTVDYSTKAKLRPHSIDDVIEINRQVQLMIANDIIEHSESTFSANVHLVPKKNGQKRMVVDFRFLNAITVKDHYPLPSMSELFLALRDAKHFAALDCTEGFLQIPVHPDDRYKTAFVTSHGSYHFKRCPFGFTNSPAKYQRTMNDIFADGLFKRCIIYIDDILVFGKTESELIENIKWVFEKCKERNVKLKLSKCKINQLEVEFLGFKLTPNKICPVSGKYDEIGVANPSKRKHILAILGALNHYARFIPNYADKTAPLRKLTRKDVPIVWTEELVQLVNNLKAELNQASSITIPDSRSDKTIDIRVSQLSIEVTCFDNNNNLVGRAGSTLSSSEQSYTIVELQLCAIALAYNKFAPFLHGKVTFRTTCKTLQGALRAVQRTDRITRIMLQLPPDAKFEIQVIPGPTPIDNLLLNEDDFDDIIYTDGACIKNGTKNCRASWAVLPLYNRELAASGLVKHDRLSNQVAEIYAVIEACKIALQHNLKTIVIATDSRYVVGSIDKWIEVWQRNDWKDNKRKPVVNQDLLKQLAHYLDQLTVKVIHVKGHSTEINNIEVDNMAREALLEIVSLGATIAQPPLINQQNDPEIDLIIANLALDASLQEKYTIANNELYYLDPELPIDSRKRLYVPASSRNILLRISHDDPLYGGHMGMKKTRAKLIGYYWPHMSRDIETFIKTCSVCQAHKTPRKPRYGYLQPIPISEIFDRVHIDIVGPMHESKQSNRYIMTDIDAFSRYAYARATPEVKAIHLIDFMTEDIFTKHGCPSQLVSDNGTQFTSIEFKAYIGSLGIKHCKTCEYHPQANGLDERLNGTLIQLLKNYIKPDQDNWDTKLNWALWLYNTTNHASIGTSPYATLFGMAPRTPLRQLEKDITSESIEENQTAHEQIRSFVAESMKRSQELQSRYYNKQRQPQDFQLLDSVMARSHYTPRGLSEKLLPKWEGPYFIYKIITIEDKPTSVVLVHEETGKFRRSAFQDLKHFESRTEESKESNDELLQLQLPGEVFQEAASRACPRTNVAHSSNKTNEFASDISTTLPTQINSRDPWISSTDYTISTIPNIISNTQSHADTEGTTTKSSDWDEIIPRGWTGAKGRDNRTQYANIQTNKRIISQPIVYSRSTAQMYNGQTVQKNAEICAHKRSVDGVLLSDHATSLTPGQTRTVCDAINPSACISCGPTTVTVAEMSKDKNNNESSNNGCVPLAQETIDLTDEILHIVQSSTPIARSNQPPNEISVQTNKISDISPPQAQVSTDQVDIQNLESNRDVVECQATQEYQPATENQATQERPKRQHKPPNRYQAPK